MNKILLLFLAITFFSCNKDIVFNKKQSIPDPWKYEDLVHFEFESPDTTNLYDLLVQVKHSKDFSNENFYTNIHTTFPSKKEVTDLISIQLANKTGGWNGECKQNCQLVLALQESFKFKELGMYQIDFENFSRENLLGLQSMHLILQKSSKSEALQE